MLLPVLVPNSSSSVFQWCCTQCKMAKAEENSGEKTHLKIQQSWPRHKKGDDSCGWRDIPNIKYDQKVDENGCKLQIRTLTKNLPANSCPNRSCILVAESLRTSNLARKQTILNMLHFSPCNTHILASQCACLITHFYWRTFWRMELFIKSLAATAEINYLF